MVVTCVAAVILGFHHDVDEIRGILDSEDGTERLS